MATPLIVIIGLLLSLMLLFFILKILWVLCTNTLGCLWHLLMGSCLTKGCGCLIFFFVLYFIVRLIIS